jgi:hypothetical protein
MSKVVLTQVAAGPRRLLFLGRAEWAGGEGWPPAPSRRPRGAGGPPACRLKGQSHDTITKTVSSMSVQEMLQNFS